MHVRVAVREEFVNHKSHNLTTAKHVRPRGAWLLAAVRVDSGRGYRARMLTPTQTSHRRRRVRRARPAVRGATRTGRPAHGSAPRTRGPRLRTAVRTAGRR